MKARHRSTAGTLAWLTLLSSIAYVWYTCFVVAASDAQGALIFMGGLPFLVFLNLLWFGSTWVVANRWIRMTLQTLCFFALLLQIFGQQEMNDSALDVFAYYHFDMSPMEFDRFFHGPD